MLIVFCHKIGTNVWNNLGDTVEIARQQNQGELPADISPDAVLKLVQRFIAERPNKDWEYVIADVCQECGLRPGEPHQDPNGMYCISCFDKIVLYDSPYR